MAMITTHCAVSRSDIVRITDFEGATVRVICGEYDDTNGGCRLKLQASAAGPLSQLLERAGEGTLSSHTVRCDFA